MKQKVSNILMILFWSFMTINVVVPSFSDRAFFTLASSEQFQKGIIFSGLNESGITKNSFLSNEAMVPVPDAIKKYYGFDISGGRTIQLFNAFLYWLKQKTQAEQVYWAQNPTLMQDEVENYVNNNGWGSVNAFSLIITTNPILQAAYGAIADASIASYQIVVQLWYCGQDRVQLWSQDVQTAAPGQSFQVNITSDADDAAVSIAATFDTNSYLQVVGSNVLQPGNRDSTTYANATDSPRMVRITGLAS